jgi:beta-glucosidase
MKKLKWIALTTTFTFLCLGICQAQSKYKYVFQNPAFSLEERVNDLVSRMNLQEKVSQMIYDAPAIERLGIPS